MIFEVVSAKEYGILAQTKAEFVDVQVSKNKLFRCIISPDHKTIYVPDYFEKKMFPLYYRVWSRIKSWF